MRWRKVRGLSIRKVKEEKRAREGKKDSRRREGKRRGNGNVGEDRVRCVRSR